LCKFFFGVVPSALAALGLLALVAGPPAARRAALAGVLVGAVGFVLLAAPPPLVAIVRASPLRFLRGQPRFTVIMGCGVALLTGAALELVRRLVPRRAPRGAAASQGSRRTRRSHRCTLAPPAAEGLLGETRGARRDPAAP